MTPHSFFVMGGFIFGMGVVALLAEAGAISEVAFTAALYLGASVVLVLTVLAILGEFAALGDETLGWLVSALACFLIVLGIAGLSSAWPVTAALALGVGTVLLLFTVDRAVRARRGDRV